MHEQGTIMVDLLLSFSYFSQVLHQYSEITKISHNLTWRYISFMGKKVFEMSQP